MATAKKGLEYIQATLNAPKNQFNKFGGYKYRSCEDILAAVKPLLAEVGGTLAITDEIVLVGDRYYVKATAVITIGTASHTVSAYAREPLSKKGMDESQITGAASSYARKYALNGLLAIDDTRDADALNDHGKGKPTPAPQKPTGVPSPASDSPQMTAEQMAKELADRINACKSLPELKNSWTKYSGRLKQMPDDMVQALVAVKDTKKQALIDALKEKK